MAHRWCSIEARSRRSRASATDQPAILGGRAWFLRRVRVDAPIAEFIPVVAEQLGGVLRAARAVAAAQGVGGAILVAAPADALGVHRMQRKLLGHGPLRSTTQGHYPRMLSVGD